MWFVANFVVMLVASLSALAGATLRGHPEKHPSATSSSASEASAKLPAVSTVLGAASKKMMTFTSQAEAMQSLVAQTEQARAAAVAKKREELETRLKKAAQVNHELLSANNALRKNLTMTTEANEVRAAEVQQLQNSNELMRDSVHDLESKMNVAADFLADTLRLSGEYSKDKFEVLEEKAPVSSIANFLKLAAGGAKNTVSLFQRRQRERPDELLQGLARSLEGVSSAVLEGEAELETEFQKLAEPLAAQEADLHKEYESLRTAQVGVDQVGAGLADAKSYLLNLRAQLQQRLQGIRMFVRKVDHETVDAFVAANAALVDPVTNKTITVEEPQASSEEHHKSHATEHHAYHPTHTMPAAAVSR